MSRVSSSMREDGSLLKAASGSSLSFGGRQGKELPLVDCPHCCVRVIKIKSKQPETYDEVYFKCPNNIKRDPTTCGFIRSEKEYEAYVRGIQERQEGLKRQLYNLEVLDETDCLGEMKHHLGEMKHQLGKMRQPVDRALGEVWTMKMQFCELKQQTSGVKKGFDIGFVVVGVVGVVFGILVTLMWKPSEL